MAMRLEKIVPFGRSLDEYIRMFNLSAADLAKNILGVGDGPASFNAEATSIGSKVTSIDPIYEFSGREILQRFNEVVDDIIAQVKATPADCTWLYHQSPEDLRNSRVETIRRFINDYEQGKQQGRYQIAELPHLQFQDHEYELALCSHFLFLYSDHLTYQFHYDGIKEMLRVSKEVRIFPLLTLMLQPSPYLEQIVTDFTELGYTVSITKVPYELQKGGNQMMLITSS